MTEQSDDDSPAELPHAESARTLVEAHSQGMLSTIDAEAGSPYGSLVEYATLSDGRVLMMLSDLAEHTVNLASDSRASVLVAEGMGDAIALSQERITLMGEVEKLDETDRLRTAYLEAHPHASGYIDFDDFNFYALTVNRVRYIGGFGRMSWVSADEYRTAQPDPLLSHHDDIVDHMNEDHADALIAMVRNLKDETWADRAVMTGVDRLGFDVAALGSMKDDDEGQTRRESLRFEFRTPVEQPDQVRSAMVTMTNRAREKD